MVIFDKGHTFYANSDYHNMWPTCELLSNRYIKSNTHLELRPESFSFKFLTSSDKHIKHKTNDIKNTNLMVLFIIINSKASCSSKFTSTTFWTNGMYNFPNSLFHCHWTTQRSFRNYIYHRKNKRWELT